MFRAIVISSFLISSALAAGDCYLRQNTSAAVGKATVADQKASKAAKKPFPSLTQCYKYNTESCCVSGHDQEIANHFKGILSDTCLR